MDDARFDALVDQALDGIPEELATLVRNVVVLVEDEPPEGEPDDLLGLYDGIALTERDSTVGGSCRTGSSSSAVRCSTSWSPRQSSWRRCGSPSCTRSRTTSGSTTRGCTSSATPEAWAPSRVAERAAGERAGDGRQCVRRPAPGPETDGLHRERGVGGEGPAEADTQQRQRPAVRPDGDQQSQQRRADHVGEPDAQGDTLPVETLRQPVAQRRTDGSAEGHEHRRHGSSTVVGIRPVSRSASSTASRQTSTVPTAYAAAVPTRSSASRDRVSSA